MSSAEPDTVASPPQDKAPAWTPSQRQAIEHRGSSVLVSAAAGSGKTSVLAERCVQLVQPGGCNIDELLVVTFTEAAAAEMRSRIERAIAADVERQFAGGAGAPSGAAALHLQQQLMRMPRAHISTLHGFCSRLIRQHFHILGLDPQFSVLDADLASLLLEETAHDLFEERYVQERFCSLIEKYGGVDDAVLQATLRIYHTLQSVPDPAGWRRDAIQKLVEASEKPLAESILGRQYLAHLRQCVEEYVIIAQRCLQSVRAHGADGKITKYAEAIAEAAQVIAESIERGDFAAARAAQKSIGKQPNLPKSEAGDALRQLIEPAKACLCGAKAAVLTDLAFSAEFLQQGLQLTLPAAREILELVDLLEERYGAAKREVNQLDFNDLERMAMRLLRDDAGHPTGVARDCHRRFQHVLVDEYQDINELQDEILRLVSRECLVTSECIPPLGGGNAPGIQPNLFCVGDVKQSIYRFRLAEPQRFLSRRDSFASGRWAHGVAIPLSENFRSREPLLGAINSVFAALMNSPRTEVIYDERESLKRGGDYPPNPQAFHGAPIELHVIDEDQEREEDGEPGEAAPADPAAQDTDDAAELDRTEREARYVGAIIHRLMGQDGAAQRQVYDRKLKAYRPLRYGDIVILLRAMSGTANVYVRQLLQLGVPAYAQSRAGFFEAVEISDMLALLELIGNARQDIPLAAVIRSPLSGIARPEDCLAEIRLFGKAHCPGAPFHEAAAQLARTPEHPWAAPLADLYRRLETWRQASRQRPIDELIWSVYHDTGYLAFCTALSRGRQRAANLLELHRRARDFAQSQKQGLPRFLQMLRDAADRGTAGEAAAARAGADTVQIMTVHASKGLEFPVVICPDLGRRFNLTDCRGAILIERSVGLGLEAVDTKRKVRYDSLASRVIANRMRDASIAEELRVLYVAMTRAREHLVLLGSARASALAKWEAAGRGASALSDEAVLSAGCSLQWLYTLSRDIAAASLRLRPVTFGEIPAASAQAPRPASERLADTTPPAAEDIAAANTIIERLGYRYPAAALCSVAAARSVTSLSKSEAGDRPAPVPADEDDAARADALQRELAPPAFMAAGPGAATAADRGSATHAALQHLDLVLFSGDADHAPLLDRELARLVAEHHLTPDQRRLISAGDILWWLATPLGRELCQQRGHVLRELPFYLAAPPAVETAALEPLDHIMIRGRIDALLARPGRICVIDYKTDRAVPPAGSDTHTAYQRQCGYYRQALQRLHPAAAISVHLVFLSARQTLEVS